MRRSMPLAFLAVLTAASGPAFGRVLEVGPGQAFQRPSEAIAAAAAGDTVRIAAGAYADCAIVHQNGLTIEGMGPDTILTDRSCAGKALLVIGGDRVTVRNLTLRGAHVPDRNGAGIRAEGGDLTVRNVRFLDNENGILSASNPAAFILVADSVFMGNGSCAAACAHGIYAGAIRLLRVERTRFSGTKEGHHVKSRARRTEVVDCDIQDGPDGTASYLIDVPNGGGVLIERNRLRKGPNSQNPATAIMIGAEGVTRPAAEIIIRDNRFTNEQNRPTVFVQNQTPPPARLSGNILRGQVTPLAGIGDSR